MPNTNNLPIAQLASSTIKGSEKYDVYPKTIDKAVYTTDKEGNESTLDKILIKDIKINNVHAVINDNVANLPVNMIESIETEESSIDGENNIVTITETNGDETVFRVKNGATGATGKSAYQSYVETTTDDPVKTETEWLSSLHGADGVSLGEVAIADNLTTNDSTKVLSAKQGYNLQNEAYFMPQKISNGNIGSTSGFTNSKYCSLSASDNVLTLTADSTGNSVVLWTSNVSFNNTHLYFVHFTARCSIDTPVTANLNNATSIGFDNLVANEWKTVSYIGKPDTSSSAACKIGFSNLKSASGETRTVEVKELTVVDLTEVFGEENEPNIIEANLMVKTWASTYKIDQEKLYDIAKLLVVEEVDMDVQFPLQSGNYTAKTAIAALPSGYATKNVRIKFVDANGKNIVLSYISDNELYVEQKKLSNWKLVGEDTYFGVNGGESSINSYQYALPMDNENKVGFGDWYYEAFIEITDGSGSNKLLASYQSSKANTCFLRLNNNNLQLCLDNQNIFSLSPSILMGKAHHFFARKNGNVFTAYVDGVQVAQTTYEITSTTTFGYFNGFYNMSQYKLYMFRFGVSSADSDAQVLEHWNNGDVLGYECKDEGLIFEVNKFGKDYIEEDVKGCLLPLNSGMVLTDAPYSAEVVASGAPSSSPQFIGQRYYDSTNKRHYVATGYSNPIDWKDFAYKSEVDAKQNALISGVTIKTINGTSILGAGNIDAGGGGGGGGSTNVVNVTDYGATGTGVTDDTSAIMQALEVARVSRLPLYFPANGGNCTYLTRKGLVLTTGMKVTADKGAILKNASAVLNDVNGTPGTGYCAFTTLTADAAVGAHTVKVTSTAGLAVGQEVTIINSNLPSYQETLADITAIDGKTITIDTSRFTASGDDEGVLFALTSGAYLMTDFSLIKTCVGLPAVDIEIENITLQACGKSDEPYVYTISPINQTKQSGTPDNAQKRIYIRDVTIDGSAQDGISTQGQSDVWIEDCIIKDVKYKGIHYGTSCDRVIIRGNYIYNCGVNVSSDGNKNGGAGAIYFCVNNHRVLIEGNHIENCRRGVFGFDYRGNQETDTDSIVRGNTFTNCHVYGIALSGGYRMIVEGNNFRNFTGDAIPINVINEGSGLQASVISNNVLGNFNNSYTNANGAISINGAVQLAVIGNVVQKNTSASGSFDIVVTSSTKVLLTGNVVAGEINLPTEGTGANTDCLLGNNIVEEP